VGLEAYNIINISSSLLQKSLLPTIPRGVHWEIYVPHTISRKKDGDNKNNSSFSVYSGCTEMPNKKTK